MNRENSFGPRCDRSFNLLRINQVGLWINIYKYGRCPSMNNCFPSRSKGMSSSYDLVVFTNPTGK